jgi:hypothetical protein
MICCRTLYLIFCYFMNIHHFRKNSVTFCHEKLLNFDEKLKMFFANQSLSSSLFNFKIQLFELNHKNFIQKIVETDMSKMSENGSQ